MSDKDKLGELSKLAGSMRYAVEGNDQATAEELRSQMENLGRHLGEKFRIEDLINAALTPACSRAGCPPSTRSGATSSVMKTTWKSLV